jgi:hypothetical protein
MSANVLPSSLLKERKGAKMGIWQMCDGRQIRCEAHPVYCAACGKLYAYAPIDNLVDLTCLCRKCFDKDPNAFAGFVTSDDAFCQAMQYEMERIHGKTLTIEEICAKEARGVLGTALELLARESPFPVPSHEDWAG